MSVHLRRRMQRAGQAGDFPITLLVQFPGDAFAGAPTWSPGPDYQTAIQGLSWYKRDPSNTSLVTAVAVSWPKTLPAYDGGEWVVPELWTASIDTGTDEGEGLFYALWDKPHRITWAHTSNAAQVVARQPIHNTHPLRVVHDYWDAFYDRHGFMPQDRDTHAPWLLLECSYLGELHQVSHDTWKLAKQWGARVSVYNRPQVEALSTEHPARAGHPQPLLRRRKKRRR